MDYAVIISAIVLGLSVLATAAKFLDWFIHTDPQTMVRVSRWMLLLLVMACIPLVVWMIVDGRWSAAMLIGAGMLAVPTFLKWRALLAPLRGVLGRFRSKVPPFDINLLAAKGSLKLTRPTLFTHTADPVACQQMARDLFDKVASGAVRIRIDQRFPLDRVAEAHRALEARETTGSTILTLR